VAGERGISSLVSILSANALYIVTSKLKYILIITTYSNIENQYLFILLLVLVPLLLYILLLLYVYI
jgi:hypothetical protein